MNSHRLPQNLEMNDFSRRIEERRGASINLTETNPTNAGLDYPEAALRKIFGNAEVFPYEPNPRGRIETRERIAALRSAGERVVRPENLWLTSGTSEAYSFLTKILADPEDEILIPTPSYPLFKHLLALDGVRAISYPLVYAEGWFIDFQALKQAITSRTRAIILVNPNNPTGHFVRRLEREELYAVASERSIPLIVDEVFLDFPLGKSPGEVSFARDHAPGLTFVLDGLSKLVGLPQVKLSWISVHGPESAAQEAARGLDWVSDLYLSVGTSVQRAISGLSEVAPDLTSMIRSRIGENHRMLGGEFGPGKTIRYVTGEGGWSAILRLPDSVDEESLVLHLVKEAGVIAHPGYFFDLPFRSSLVVSLLPEPTRFREGIDKIVSVVEGMK